MIRTVALSIGQILLGLILIAVPVALIRFGILPLAADIIGWSDEVNALLRRSLIIVAIAGGFWAFIRLTEKRSPTELSLRWGPITMAGLAGVVGISIPMLIFYLEGSYKLEAVQFDAAIFPLALFILGAAFLEEAVFRGVLFGVLNKQFGFWSALLLSSAIFSILHFFNAEWGGWISFTSGLLLGVMWTLVYVHTQNLWAATANHALWNFTIVLAGAPLTGQQQWRELAPLQTSVSGADWWSGGNAGPEDTILTIAVVTVVCAWLLLKRQGASPQSHEAAQ